MPLDFLRHALQSRVASISELTPAEIGVWDRLCFETSHLQSPFLSPHFCKAVGIVKPHVMVCIITRSAEPVAFLPFQFMTQFRRALRSGERVGAEMSDYFGLVAKADVRVSHLELLRLAHLSTLEFTHLDESQAIHGLQGEKPEVGLLIRLRPGISHWDEIRRRDKKFVADTDRLEKQLEATAGKLRFVAEDDAKDALERLIYWKGQQYTKTGRPNLFASEWRSALLHELNKTQTGTCAGVLSSLYAGDYWLASHFGLRSQSVLHYWFPVYNPEFGRYSPGRLLEKHLIEYAANLQIETIDLGAGDSTAKRRVANAEHTYYRNLWYGRDLWSLAGRAVHSLAWRMAAVQGT